MFPLRSPPARRARHTGERRAFPRHDDSTTTARGGRPPAPGAGPARHDEPLLMQTIYRFHPDYAADTVWWGDPEKDWGQATLEGGDVM
ncbi:arginine deiminase family protein, partial [Nocardia farcinica]|uniref:arginine deiminase family protein n=1 Tax=Nocardia farcinica TaxID=37329 RepID=UPI003CC7F6FF